MSTEEKILRAAEKEFLDKGYGGARTTAIAEAAGVTHAMLHYYFRTKEKLFQRIITEKITHLKGMMLSPLLDSGLPLEQKVKSAIETHLDFLSANPDLPRFMLSILASNSEWKDYIRKEIYIGQHRIVELLQAEIDHNAAEGKCRPTDAAMLLLDIISLNVFSFIGAPLVNQLLGDFHTEPGFLKARKKNNVELILQKLKTP